MGRKKTDREKILYRLEQILKYLDEIERYWDEAMNLSNMRYKTLAMMHDAVKGNIELFRDTFKKVYDDAVLE